MGVVTNYNWSINGYSESPKRKNGSFWIRSLKSRQIVSMMEK